MNNNPKDDYEETPCYKKPDKNGKCGLTSTSTTYFLYCYNNYECLEEDFKEDSYEALISFSKD